MLPGAPRRILKRSLPLLPGLFLRNHVRTGGLALTCPPFRPLHRFRPERDIPVEPRANSSAPSLSTALQDFTRHPVARHATAGRGPGQADLGKVPTITSGTLRREFAGTILFETPERRTQFTKSLPTERSAGVEIYTLPTRIKAL